MALSVPSSLRKHAASAIVYALWSKGLRGEKIGSALPEPLIKVVIEAEKELMVKSWRERRARITQRVQIRQDLKDKR